MFLLLSLEIDQFTIIKGYYALHTIVTAGMVASKSPKVNNLKINKTFLYELQQIIFKYEFLTH